MQEAAILGLEERNPGIGERIRALLELERQGDEAIRKLEARAAKEKAEREWKAEEIARKLAAEAKVEQPSKDNVVPLPVAGEWRLVQKPDGSKWKVRGNDWRRYFGPVPQLRVVEQAKPEPEPEPKSEPAVEPEEKPEVEPKPEVVVEVVRDEEDEPEKKSPVRVGIAPGLVGEVADFTLGSAMYPSEAFAVGGSIPLVGTLIGRRIAGPSGALGTATHLYIGIVGPTGSGKEQIRATSKLLMATASAAALIGPGRFKSGAGIMSYLAKKPLSLCVMDEFGSMLARITHRNAQHYQMDETEILREIWGISWGRYDSPEGAYDESVPIFAPALSIIGMSTPKELWKACKSKDIGNGFLNRFLFIEEKAHPQYQRVTADTLNVPKEFKVGLARLYQPAAALMAQPMGGVEYKPAFRMDWGPGAEEVYDEVRVSVEQETDERKRGLFWRSAEKAVRVATSVAAGCFSKTVDRDHMEWARRFVATSDETLLAGIEEHMEEEKLEFAELCREIIRRVRQWGGKMRRREIGRSFQNNVTYGNQIWQAVDHLVTTDQLTEHRDDKTGGRPSLWYSLPRK
jgi:hypothetical protein